MKPFALILVSICFISTMAWGEENPTDPNRYWPAWRGPLGTGVAPLGNPPVEWGEKKNLRWKVEIPGEGHATPVVWEDQIFILAAVETGKAIESKEEPEEERSGGRRRMRIVKPTTEFAFNVMAIDRKSGKILWQQTACEILPHEGKHGDGSFASNSPITDGERVYAHFGSRGLYCYDLAGKLLWKKDLGKMETRRSFGEGSSPALHGDTLVVNWDHEGPSFIVALDKKTGKELWRNERNEKTSWATPLVVEHNGKPQVITNGSEAIRSYDLLTGDLIWECGGMTENAVPCPVYKDGLVYLMTGFRGSALLAIDLNKASKDITGSKAIVWEYNKGTPYVPSPLLYEETLYFLQVNEGYLSCLNAKTGKANYTRQELDGIKGVYASPVGASGRVYLAGRDGVVLVLQQGPEYKVLAKNSFDDAFNASPAIVDKELFLRGRNTLYCIAQD